LSCVAINGPLQYNKHTNANNKAMGLVELKYTQQQNKIETLRG